MELKNNRKNGMQKKIPNIFKFVLYIIIGFCLGLFSCLFIEKNSQKKINNIILKNNYELKMKDDKPVKIVCDEIKDSISYSDGYFITTLGDIYRFNANKLFSNNKNCIKIESGNSDLSYIFLNGIYDKDNQEIYHIYENDIFTLEEYNQLIKNEYLDMYEKMKELEKKNPPFMNFSNYDLATLNCGDDFGETMVIKNNIVYGLDNIFKKENEWLEIGKIPNDEKIIYANNFLIKTNKAYWEFSIINEEQCNKYVDIKCEKRIVKSSLSHIYDEIMFATGDMLIDNKYNLYEKKKCITLN